jgi:hypothetical protein
MQTKGFFSSLFDYSFGSFVTPKIIRVLYVLLTIAVSLWTLTLLVLAFKASTGLGIVFLLIGGPIFFVLAMIYWRVVLELVIVFFRIHEDVADINHRGGGTLRLPVMPVPVPPEPGPGPAKADEPALREAATAVTVTATTPEPVPEPPPTARFCENCGAERSPGTRFCTGCGEPLE